MVRSQAGREVGAVRDERFNHTDTEPAAPSDERAPLFECLHDWLRVWSFIDGAKIRRAPHPAQIRAAEPANRNMTDATRAQDTKAFKSIA
jgi:hypothetical protein